MKIRAGAAQFAGSRNWEENLAAIGRLTETAADDGVQMIGFHELTTEELDRVEVSAPGGPAMMYGATSVDRYGNESELSTATSKR